MIHVIAMIETASGRRDEFLNIFRELTPKVHAEDGCIEYGVAIDAITNIDIQTPAGDDKSIVIEKWRDADALAAHLAAPHMAAFRDDVEGIVTRLTIRVLSPID